MADKKLNEIVDVQITRDSVAVNVANINNSLFLAPSVPFAEQSRKYSSLTAMIEDGFNEKDPAYRAMERALQQGNSNIVVIGNAGVKVFDLSLVVADIANSTDYSVSIALADGYSAEYTTTSASNATDDAAAEIESIVDALIVLIVADASVTGIVTATKVGAAASAVLNLTGSEAFHGSSNELSVAYTSPSSWADVLTAQIAYDNGFYVVNCYSHLQDDILDIAAFVETEKLIYGYSIQDAEALVAKTAPAAAGDTMGKLNDLGYERTFGIYHGDADDRYPEMGLASKKLPAKAGGTTWMFTRVVGIVADNLSTSESSIIRDKEGNSFEDIAGIAIIREGTMASGEYIDVMRGTDDLHGRIQTEVFRALVVEANKGSKIPYTDAGVAQIKSIVEAEIRRSITNNFVAKTIQTTDDGGNVVVLDGYAIEADLVSSVPVNQRAGRQAPDIRFTAVLSSAIHKTIIKGALSI